MSFVETKKKLDSEKNPVEQYNVLKSIENGVRVVKLHGVTLGVVTSDEDEKAMIELLSHYGSLDNPESLGKTLLKMYNEARIATDLRNSGFKPEMEITENGKSKFVIDGKLYDENGTKIGEINK